MFHRHKNRVYDFAVAMLGDRDVAGDVVQDVFIGLYTQMNNGTKILTPKSWLLAATRNLCLNRIRDSRKQTALEDSTHVAIDDASDEAIHDVLEAALQSLDGNLREVLILREYQNLSYAEMAEILGTTVPAVRSNLYRARIDLREAYRKLTAMRKE
jgi:RNA polymerase sigma-70 factor (ECF subfamily)